jgi:type I restriction enzyme, S subunit
VKLQPIGEQILPIKNWSPNNEAPDKAFSYIDISSINRSEKRIEDVQKILGSEAPSRARQLVKSGDVLVSTVRPSLNAVAIVPDSYDGSTASTGYCVLRPDTSKLFPTYLFHWVKTQQFINEMVKQATGANYPAVSDRIVKESKILLPTIPEQKRIATILDKADALREKRRQAIARLDELLQSVFLDMFGDPVTNPKGWNIYKVGDIVSDFVGGKNIKCLDECEFSPLRMLKISAVTWGEYNPAESKPVPLDFKPLDFYFVKKGDLLISRANTSDLVAATVYVWDTPNNILLPDKLWRFVFSKKFDVEPLFVLALFNNRSFHREISKRSSGTSGSMKNISKAKLNQVEMILPPIETQKRFNAFTKKLHLMKQNKISQLDTFDNFFSSLQHLAFKGEL